MATYAPHRLRMSGSWSTQLRFMQAIGRGLAERLPVEVMIVVSPRRNALEAGEVDVTYSSRSTTSISSRAVVCSPVPSRHRG